MTRHFVDGVMQGECPDTQISYLDMGSANRVREAHVIEEVRDRELRDTCDALSGSSC